MSAVHRLTVVANGSSRAEIPDVLATHEGQGRIGSEDVHEQKHGAYSNYTAQYDSISPSPGLDHPQQVIDAWHRACRVQSGSCADRGIKCPTNEAVAKDIAGQAGRNWL